MKKLSIVIPCYNEESALPYTFDALTKILNILIDDNKISDDSYMLFVDDGSKDKTWEIIENEHAQNKFVKGVKLAGNVGHQNALLAGLLAAKQDCDISVSIDADLQDDVNAIIEMVDKANEGADIVYGVRNDRSTDTAFKRTTAEGFYKFMSLLGVKTVYNHADFRLMSKRALDALSEFSERELFLRGIVPMIGYNTDYVYYKRSERVAGESKYPLKKMLKFATNGIVSFSTKPLEIITALGFIITLLSILAFIYVLIGFFFGLTVAGWPSLMVSIWFLGGVQLLSLGVIGQYVGKTYSESKRRPRFIIEKII